jgi:hypothetical protein
MRKSICLYWVICFALRVSGQTPTQPAQTKVVPVPTLVEVQSGAIAYDLSARDFSIKDDGVEQQVQLSDTDLQPRSVLLVVQTGRNASAQLGKMEHLDELLDAILTGPADEVGSLLLTAAHMPSKTSRRIPIRFRALSHPSLPEIRVRRCSMRCMRRWQCSKKRRPRIVE